MKYGVSYVDFGKDGKPSERVVLGEEFASYKNAEAYVIEDMRSYIDEHTSDTGQCSFVMDDARMTCRDMDWAEGRDWAIFKIREKEGSGQANPGPEKR